MRRWKPTFAACRTRTTNCGNTSLACNLSFSSRPESLHPRRRRHLAGGERLSQLRITCHTIALPRLHSLQASPPRVRLPRAARGVSTLIICANGIVSTQRIEVLLAVVRRLTPRRRSEWQRIKLVFALYFASCDWMSLLNNHQGCVRWWKFFFGCCCWSGAAFAFYWLKITYLQYLQRRRRCLLLHYRTPTGVVNRPLFKFCSQNCTSNYSLYQIALASYIHPPSSLFTFCHIAHFTLKPSSTPPHQKALRQQPMRQQTLQPLPEQQTVTT